MLNMNDLLHMTPEAIEKYFEALPKPYLVKKYKSPMCGIQFGVFQRSSLSTEQLNAEVIRYDEVRPLQYFPTEQEAQELIDNYLC